MDQEEIHHFFQRAKKILYNFLALFLIVSLFFFLTLFHAELGGFDTVKGTLIGVLTLLLFFFPIIDLIIKWSFKIKAKTWFQLFLNTINVTKLALSISAFIGITIVFLSNVSWSGFVEFVKSILTIFFE